MSGVLVNVLAVVCGSAVGLLLKKGIPERISGAVMSVLGLCTLYIGISGALSGSNTVVLIVSMVIGTILGTLIDIDDKINRVGLYLEKKFKKGDGETTIAEGFMTASMLFCVGSMTIVGSLNAGLTGDNTLLFTKATLDLCSSCMLASSLGIGVMFSAVFVLIYQGGLVLCAGLLQNVLSDPALINEITCAGSIMIIGMGLNLLGITKLKTANFMPAIVVTPIVYLAASKLL